MSTTKIIVLDANILIRAVLGIKARNLIQNHANNVLFFTPDCCYENALKYLPILMERLAQVVVGVYGDSRELEMLL